MMKSKLLYVQYFLFGFSVILISLLLCMMFILFSSSSSIHEYDNISSLDESSVFRLLRINPSKREVSHGFVKLNSLGDDNSIFYPSESGAYNLISHFDEDEYQCIGSCSCNDDYVNNNRKSSLSQVRSSLYFLVGAATSIIAYTKANEYFQSECEMKLEDECQIITSTVDSCDNVKVGMPSVIKKVKKFFDQKKETKKVEEIERTEDRGFDFKYICTGHCRLIPPVDVFNVCYRNKIVTYGPSKKGGISMGQKRKGYARIHKKHAKKLRCPTITLTKTIDRKFMLHQMVHFSGEDEAKMFLEEFAEIKEEEGMEVLENRLDVSIYSVFALDLHEYCLGEGKVDLAESMETKGYKKKEGVSTEVNVCEGWKGAYVDISSWEKKRNPTVRCVREFLE